MQEWQMKIIKRDSLRLNFPIFCTAENSEWFVQIDGEEKTNNFEIAMKTLDEKYEEV
jgi:hypothetical protein